MGLLTKMFDLFVYKPLRAIKHQIVTDDYWTSFNLGHRHSWKKGAKYTSWNAFHKHKIDVKKKMALLGGIVDHTHKLLK